MDAINGLMKQLKDKFGKAEAKSLWDDNQKVIELYDIYDGNGQVWLTNDNAGYEVTQKITNHIKHLIKEEARYMFSIAPDIFIKPLQVEEIREKENKEKCEAFSRWLTKVLEENGWQEKLTKAGRDAFIGKRIAIKLWGETGKNPRILFKPSITFFHDVEEEDNSRLKAVLFYYHHTCPPGTPPHEQETWMQYYFYDDQGRVLVDEFTCNGKGDVVAIEKDNMATGLTALPAYVIYNDGLTDDVKGESDVAELWSNQDHYNRKTSDDMDALKFNMFPQTVVTDASQDSADAIKVSPGALIDVQTDPTKMGSTQAKIEKLEARFGYDQRLENALDRIQNDMYTLLSVPKVQMEELKSLGISGKAMRAIYWPLTCRCEEKWAHWDSAIKWMVPMLYEMAETYQVEDFKSFEGAQYKITIEHRYPLPDDEEEKRKLDLQEVANHVMSREQYIRKWYPDENPKDILKSIAAEIKMIDQTYDTDLY